MFKRIDHIELLTAQPERAIGFYTEVLDFKVRARDRVAADRWGRSISCTSSSAARPSS